MSHYLKKANGKLLLTSEYFVLDGAEAIVLPTKFGQSLEVFKDENLDKIHWKSLDELSNVWLELLFDINFISDIHSKEAETLRQILVTCYEMNPAIAKTGWIFETRLDFNRQWGLGSSATLIALLADFFQINPYVLLEKTFGGSGYDIAAAFQPSTFLYNNQDVYHPSILPYEFNVNFKEQLYFVYLGKKQNSRQGIQHYKQVVKENTGLVNTINEIVDLFKKANALSDFNEAIQIHEDFIVAHLRLEKVKNIYFKDYWGEVKSLGAWGGDFVLMTNDRGEEELVNYLKSKEFYTILTFNSMIK